MKRMMGRMKRRILRRSCSEVGDVMGPKGLREANGRHILGRKVDAAGTDQHHEGKGRDQSLCVYGYRS